MMKVLLLSSLLNNFLQSDKIESESSENLLVGF